MKTMPAFSVEEIVRKGRELYSEFLEIDVLSKRDIVTLGGSCSFSLCYVSGVKQKWQEEQGRVSYSRRILCNTRVHLRMGILHLRCHPQHGIRFRWRLLG